MRLWSGKNSSTKIQLRCKKLNFDAQRFKHQNGKKVVFSRLFSTIENDELRLFCNSDSGGRGFESRQPYQENRLILDESGGFLNFLRCLEKARLRIVQQ